MDLIAAMRAHYSRSKFLMYKVALPIAVWIYVAALIAALPVANWFAGVLAVAALAAQIAAFMLRVVAMDSIDMGENIRRTAMLQDGLGVVPSPLQLARLMERTPNVNAAGVPLLAPYYGSHEPVGMRRLLDITAECAFFTHGLARRMWKVFALVALVGFLTPVLTIMVVLLAGAPQSVLEVAGKAVVASMAFWAAGEFAMMALQFFQLSRDADRVMEKCEGVLAGPGHNIDSEALTAFDEYNCAVAKAPPIPDAAYNRWGNGLNAAWAQRQAAHQPAPQPAAVAPAP